MSEVINTSELQKELNNYKNKKKRLIGFWPLFIICSIIILLLSFIVLYKIYSIKFEVKNTEQTNETINTHKIDEPEQNEKQIEEKDNKDEYNPKYIDKNGELALQFDGYKFGSNIEEIIQQIKDKNPNTNLHKDRDIISYIGEFFDYPCTMKFVFTSKTSTLYGVQIVSPIINNNFKIIMDAFKSKFGEPSEGRSDFRWETDASVLGISKTYNKINILYMSRTFKKLADDENIEEAFNHKDSSKI